LCYFYHCSFSAQLAELIVRNIFKVVCVSVCLLTSVTQIVTAPILHGNADTHTGNSPPLDILLVKNTPPINRGHFIPDNFPPHTYSLPNIPP